MHHRPRQVSLPSYHGCFPEHVTRIPALTCFSVSGFLGVGLIDIPPGLSALAGLRRLLLVSSPPMLRGPGFTPCGREAISACTQLTSLELEGLAIINWPGWLGGLPRLQHLGLRRNRITTVPSPGSPRATAACATADGKHPPLLPPALTRLDLSCCLCEYGSETPVMRLRLPECVTTLSALRQLKVGPEWRSQAAPFHGDLELAPEPLHGTGGVRLSLVQWPAGASTGAGSSGGGCGSARQAAACSDAEQQPRQAPAWQYVLEGDDAGFLACPERLACAAAAYSYLAPRLVLGGRTQPRRGAVLRHQQELPTSLGFACLGSGGFA